MLLDSLSEFETACDQVTCLPSNSSLDHALSRDSASDSGRDAGALDLNLTHNLCPFHPELARRAAQLMDDILTPIPIKIKSIS